MTTKSIRWRLLSWLALMLVALLAGFGLTAFRLIERDRQQQIDETLARRVSVLVADRRGRAGPRDTPGAMGGPNARNRPSAPPTFGAPPNGTGRFDDELGPPPLPPDDDGPNRLAGGPPGLRDGMGPGPGGQRKFTPSAQTLAMFDDADPEAPYYGYWVHGGDSGYSGRAPAKLPQPPLSDADSRIHFRTRGGFREAFYFTERSDCLLSGVSLAEHAAALRRFAWWLALAGGVVLVTGVGGGWLLVTAALRPVEKIGATAGRIAAGALSERIDMAETESELGRLALVLNGTFARLEAAFDEQRQFTADASHEIRTPLAVIISEAQSTLARERPAAEYRESIEICLEAAQQMRRLAESLLELARFDAGQEGIRREAVDLGEIARRTAMLMAPLARERRIEIDVDAGRANCAGDDDRLQQVARNLVDNAIYYNVDGGRVSVRTWRDGAMVRLSVADTGRGIAREDLPQLFRRFYRADRSRSRAGGRSGLGLAICRAIVEAHGGTITATSEVGRGTTVVVSLPAGPEGAG